MNSAGAPDSEPEEEARHPKQKSAKAVGVTKVKFKGRAAQAPPLPWTLNVYCELDSEEEQRKQRWQG